MPRTVDPAPVPSVDVVVPTFRRPALLERCLGAIASQHRPPERCIVVARADDTPTWSVLSGWQRRTPSLRAVAVDRPGVIAALTAGVSASSSSAVAITDDDAAPRHDWLEMVVTRLGEPGAGGVGGRDIVRGQEWPVTDIVGRYTWTGRRIGNHHMGTGPARDVDVLKGVNMAFRVEALALPRPGVLRGGGAQVHFEILVCAWAARHGWRLVYDPLLVVDHDAGDRVGPDQRGRPRASAVVDAAHNAALGSLLGAPGFRGRSFLYEAAVGTSGEPGFLRAGVAVLRREREVLRRAPGALAGRAYGLARFLRGMSLDEAMVTAAELRAGAGAREV